MGVIVPEGYASLAFVHSGPATGTAPYIWTIGVRLDPESTNPTLEAQQVMTYWRDAWYDNLRSSVTSYLTLDEIRATINDGSAVGTVVLPVGTAGTASADMAPSNCTILVNKYSSQLGRKGRGRCNLPGMAVRAALGMSGTIDNPLRSALQGAWNDFVAQASAGDGINSWTSVPVLLHSGPETPSVITSYSVDAKVGTLRKRIR